MGRLERLNLKKVIIVGFNSHDLSSMRSHSVLLAFYERPRKNIPYFARYVAKQINEIANNQAMPPGITNDNQIADPKCTFFWQSCIWQDDDDDDDTFTWKIALIKWTSYQLTVCPYRLFALMYW